MKTALLAPSNIEHVASFLREGAIVALPTETVFGLAVRYDDEEAYERLLDCKKRPKEKAFPLLVPSREFIDKFAIVSTQAKRVIQAFLPGPLTVVLTKKEGLPCYVGYGQSTLAIRIPDDPFIQMLSCHLNVPLFLTSANRSGEAPVPNSLVAYERFQNEIAAVVEGVAGSNVASTIVDLSRTTPKILRQGTITLEEIEAVWREPSMKIAIGSDHAGFPAKKELKEALEQAGYHIVDYGTHSESSCHYPTYGIAVGEAVAQGAVDYGIVICGTGIGISIAANKVRGVRCALVEDVERAHLARQHNNANVLALAGRFTPVSRMIEIAHAFLTTAFEEGRHQQRIDLIGRYEQGRDSQ